MKRMDKWKNIKRWFSWNSSGLLFWDVTISSNHSIKQSWDVTVSHTQNCCITCKYIILYKWH